MRRFKIPRVVAPPMKLAPQIHTKTTYFLDNIIRVSHSLPGVRLVAPPHMIMAKVRRPEQDVIPQGNHSKYT
jgi:hypothetical protein